MTHHASETDVGMMIVPVVDLDETRHDLASATATAFPETKWIVIAASGQQSRGERPIEAVRVCVSFGTVEQFNVDHSLCQ